jgi:hypothetical protein
VSDTYTHVLLRGKIFWHVAPVLGETSVVDFGLPEDVVADKSPLTTEERKEEREERGRSLGSGQGPTNLSGDGEREKRGRREGGASAADKGPLTSAKMEKRGRSLGSGQGPTNLGGDGEEREKEKKKAMEGIV